MKNRVSLLLGYTDLKNKCCNCKSKLIEQTFLVQIVKTFRLQKRHWWSKKKELLPWNERDNKTILCLTCIHKKLLELLKK